MPSFEKYKNNVGARFNGQQRKYQAAQIVEATWEEDINYQKAYLFDYYHDPCITQLNDFEPEKCKDLVPIDVHYIRDSSQTYAKDNVTYRIELRPSQEINVPYYESLFAKKYDAMFPTGLYILLQNSKGKYNRWLVVSPANIHDSQFPTWDVLMCDHILQYIFDNKKYQIAGVGRSQNSYNSGLWEDDSTIIVLQ